MPLPESHEWEVRNTRLGEACRKLLPFARDRITDLAAKETVAGTQWSDEVRALGAFIAACRTEGLDR